MDNTEKIINRTTLSWLNSVNGISNGYISKLIEIFQSPKEIWYNFENEYHNIRFLSDSVKTQLLRSKNNFPSKLNNIIEKENINIITLFDKEYPTNLKVINNPPYILYVKGDLSVLKGTLIAVVGSRKATSYGKWVAEKLTRELSNLGVTIVSGFANGLDTIAHETAIKNNTKTIAVFGSGIDVIYPKKNYNLYQDIISNGALVTEYTFGMRPLASNFPNRNRIISGLCEGVLVIEAKQKSGTLITASYAAEQGREVFAVPGNIDSLYSKGTNALIKDGAKITTSIEDICDEISSLKNKTCDKKTDYKSLNKKETKIIKLLETGEKTMLDLNQNIDLQVNEIFSILTILEMKGLVKQMEGKKFSLAN